MMREGVRNDQLWNVSDSKNKNIDKSKLQSKPITKSSDNN